MLLLFGAVGLLILTIACINYANLAIARALPRSREIGLRKMVGATRGQLVAQFGIEAFLMVAVSLGTAALLYDALLSAFNEWMGLDLAPLPIGVGSLTGWVGGAILLALAAGAWPAMYLSRLNPVAGMKGGTRASSNRRTSRVLVSFQFFVTLALVASTIVIQRQLSFIRNNESGLDAERVVVVSARHSVVNAQTERFTSLKDRLLAGTHVQAASFGSALPGTGTQGGGTLSLPGGGEDGWFFVDSFEADPDLIPTLGLELVAGRNFDPARSDYMTRGIILNQASVEALKALASDPELTQETIVGRDVVFERRDVPRQVIGVVRDFHHRSLHERVQTSAILPKETDGPENYYAAIKLAPGNPEEGVAAIRTVWTSLFPEIPFDATFLTQRLEAQYRADIRFGRLFRMFSFVGILLSCFGLFGLASFAVARRTKEIGIRKVLGASVGHIVGTLSMDYLKLVAFGFLLAVPLVWFGMHRWLEAFAYRTDMPWWMFAAAGLLVALVAAATVGTRAIRAARKNPAVALRS